MRKSLATLTALRPGIFLSSTAGLKGQGERERGRGTMGKGEREREMGGAGE